MQKFNSSNNPEPFWENVDGKYVANISVIRWFQSISEHSVHAFKVTADVSEHWKLDSKLVFVQQVNDTMNPLYLKI